MEAKRQNTCIFTMFPAFMGRFGVVMCPKCKRLNAVSLATIRTKCAFCQRSFSPGKLKTFAESDSERDIRAYLLALSNNKYGIEKETGKDGPYDGAEKLFPMLGEVTNKKEKWAYIVRILGDGGETFTEDELGKHFLDFGLDIEEGSKWLKESHIIYEPSPGTYKLL